MKCDEKFWEQVKFDIIEHLRTLKNYYNILKINEALDYDENEPGNKFIPWFELTAFDKLNLITMCKLNFPDDGFQRLQENPLMLIPSAIVTGELSDIIRQLGLILPDTQNCRSALPVLITAYILKYKKGMSDSTLAIMQDLVCGKLKAGVNGLLKRLTLEPWFNKFKNVMPEYSKITTSSRTVVRSYYVCLIFTAILLESYSSLDMSPYLGIRLCEYLGGYMRLFLEPLEMLELKLTTPYVQQSPDLDKRTIEILEKHFVDATEVEKDAYKAELIEFCLRMKLAVLNQKVTVLKQNKASQLSLREELEKMWIELEESLTSEERMFYLNYSNRDLLYFYCPENISDLFAQRS